MNRDLKKPDMGIMEVPESLRITYLFFLHAEPPRLISSMILDTTLLIHAGKSP
jgi:hypothetical protein